VSTRIETRRIYESSRKSGEFRVLVDRLWPRGISKEDADLDEWAKDLTPSSELRKWFHRDRERWDEFRDAYLAELGDRSAEARELLENCGRRALVLLYAAKDRERNHAEVLADFLRELD